jgi:septal ring factor EnvC (AmiA/AmiB activator)
LEDQLNSLKEVETKHEKVERTVEELETEIANSRQVNEEMEKEIEVSKEQKRTKIPYESTKHLLCGPCHKKVFRNLRPKDETNKTLMESQVSMFATSGTTNHSTASR